MPGTYPSYTLNTQDTSHDLPGRTDIANAADYNDHDVQIVAHQAVLINHEARVTNIENRVVVPDGTYFFDGTTAGTVAAMTVANGLITSITVR